MDNRQLRSELERLAPALVPLFTTDFRRTTWTIGYRRSTIEVALDLGHVACQGRRSRLCELELELVAGDVADLFALARELQDAIPLHPAVVSKAERGYDLFAGTPPVPGKFCPPALTAAMPPVEAFRHIVLACLEHLQRNEAGIQGDGDPEFVHQARVALRRLRSALGFFRPVLPADFSETYGRTWRALATPLGTARDWDVLVEDILPAILAAFPEDRSLRRLQDTARRRARQARTAVAHALAEPGHSRLLVDFTASLVALPEADAAPSLEKFADRRLRHRAERAYRLAARHRSLDVDERHRLRLHFKKLRYVLEFLAPFLPRRRVKPYLAALTRLQDELGQINDHATAESLIKELSKDGPAPAAQGWIAGRHALLVDRLPEAMERWMTQKAPWKNP